jgi:hypothetical protein
VRRKTPRGNRELRSAKCLGSGRLVGALRLYSQSALGLSMIPHLIDLLGLRKEQAQPGSSIATQTNSRSSSRLSVPSRSIHKAAPGCCWSINGHIHVDSPTGKPCSGRISGRVFPGWRLGTPLCFRTDDVCCPQYLSSQRT